MAQNDFLIVNESLTNIMPQVDFVSNGQRKDGVVGIAVSPLHNKIYHQSSIMSHVIGQFIADAGGIAQDIDPIALLSAFKNAIMNGIENATETKRGVAMIATNADVIAGTNDEKIITPKKLKSNISNLVPDATTAVKGIIRIATDAEAIAGTATNISVTPAQLKFSIPILPQATEILMGGAKVATQAETDAGVIDTHIVTPLKLKNNITPLLALKAPIASPKFTGQPENTTATTVYEESRITNTWISYNTPTNTQGRNGDVWYQLT